MERNNSYHITLKQVTFFIYNVEDEERAMDKIKKLLPEWIKNGKLAEYFTIEEVF